MEFLRTLHAGWFRLWVVAAASGCLALAAAAAYLLGWQDACYRYVSVTPAESLSRPDADVLARLLHDAQGKTYCGARPYSVLLTLEQLAKDGHIANVSLQWQEPAGWSFSDFDTLDVLDGQQLRASLIVSRMHRFVRQARLRSLLPWAIVLAAGSLGVLLLGMGVAWVRRGFAPGSRHPAAATPPRSPVVQLWKQRQPPPNRKRLVWREQRNRAPGR